MTPFREKPVSWDGDTGEDKRYENKKGFKFDIVSQTVVKGLEDMPRCFLADTPEEALAVYKQHEKMLNGVVGSYAATTGQRKSDLFSEALIGLARARRDWDPSRSEKFEVYAIFRVKDALNEFIRENASSVPVPHYIKKANFNLRTLKSVCEATQVDYGVVVEKRELPDGLNTSARLSCEELLRLLSNAAERAKVEWSEFIERIEFLPEMVEFTEVSSFEPTKKMEAKAEVAALKKKMDPEELAISEGILAGKSFDQIAKDMGKSKAWVSDKLKAFRQKVCPS